MKRKIFAVSDIHGDYDALIHGLLEAGYDENNKKHLLVVLGDNFDRGSQSLDVYNYLKKLTDEGKAVVIMGNHDLMFIDYLTGECITPFNYMHNGENETFAEFLHQTAPFEMYCLLHGIDDKEVTYGDFAEWVSDAREEINNEYPELLPWLQSLPYYYETKNYIFTHGAIDTEANNWKEPHIIKYSYTDWQALTWDDGSFFSKPIINTDKTVVIGHFGTMHLRDMYDLSYEDGKKSDILTRDDGRVIAIDATTIATHRVNVLVVEDELL